MAETGTGTIHLRKCHPKQAEFVNCDKKRIIIRAGRRGGKTVGLATRAVKRFLLGRRQLYAVPTAEQVNRFWFEVKKALQEPLDAGYLVKNESEHFIEEPGTLRRIKAKTAWNADTLRGDYADDLYLDEWQLMDESAWGEVGAPMLLDNNGDAVFCYTPPSIHSKSITKARDPRHASKLFLKAKADTTGRWGVFHFSSRDNPYISEEALAEIVIDMTETAFRQEILAEDIEEAPGALWNRKLLEDGRVVLAPRMDRIVVALDPSSTGGGDEAGIIVAGKGTCYCKGKDKPEKHAFVLFDGSVQARPEKWAEAAVVAYHKFSADCLVAEDNNGGEMVEVTINTIPNHPPVKRIHASRGKVARAEPISLLYKQGIVHHVGDFQALEEELCTYEGDTGQPSPNRYDALVWAITELKISSGNCRGLLQYYTEKLEARKREEEEASAEKKAVNG